jgi:hypothetical protein
MTDIEAGIKLADPKLYENLKKSLDLNEIRGSERIVIQDWFGKALVTESLLNLVRDGLIDVAGLENYEPTFVISLEGTETIKQILNESTENEME